jgi:hypothetical protein
VIGLQVGFTADKNRWLRVSMVCPQCIAGISLPLVSMDQKLPVLWPTNKLILPQPKPLGLTVYDLPEPGAVAEADASVKLHGWALTHVAGFAGVCGTCYRVLL